MSHMLEKAGFCGATTGLIGGWLFGFDALQSMLIATALTATSIAISIQVLSEFGKIKSKKGLIKTILLRLQ